MEMKSMQPDQVAKALEELAVNFSEEEWALLDPGQSALNKEFMEEALTHVVSLGSSPPHLPSMTPSSSMP